MAESSVAPSGEKSMEEKPSSSTSASLSAEEVQEESKKLIGAGNRHMVMGDVLLAVNAFQEACGLLAKMFGDTADECGEAFFLCGKALLELARMENTVLGNALDGVPEEGDEECEEGEKKDDSKIESADNLDDETRNDLRVQVYEAMAEKVEKAVVEGGDEEAKKDHEEAGGRELKDVTGGKGSADEAKKNEDASAATKAPAKEVSASEDVTTEQNSPEAKKVDEEEEGDAMEVSAALSAKEVSPDEDVNVEEKSVEVKKDSTEEAPVKGAQMSEAGGVEEKEVDMEGANNEVAKNAGGAETDDAEKSGEDEEEEDDDDDDERETTAENKENEEDEVGNLQLAWEMLEVAKVIFRRKRSKEEELQTAQVHLKLGEVSAESGNYSQALEDFQECLTLQLKHLPPHSRLLAETHYQLGLTFGYTTQYSQAIKHFNSSIQVIESCLAMLQEAIDKAEGEAAEERREMEELKKLLPDIREKVEDAKESQKTAAVASEAIHQTLTGSSSGFSAENGGTSVSNAAAEGASSSKSASDISHLVRKKRKPEESPVKNGDAKKAKQEAEVNGSGDTNCGGANGVQDAMEQEGPTQPANPVETSV